MGYESNDLPDLIREIQKASATIAAGDTKFDRRLDDFESSLNSVMRERGRPWGPGGEVDAGDERRFARELCVIKAALDAPKSAGAKELVPSASDIDSAIKYKVALRSLLRAPDPSRLEPEFRKSLTSFSFGASDYIMPPEWSSRVLRCLVDPTDLTGLVNNESISGASIKFPIDNTRMSLASWACETSCFANNPMQDLQNGLGELEIKVESIRHVVCAGKDLLEDSSFNFESWLMRRAAQGYTEALSAAILVGDGVGKPTGLLHPRSGVPICETAAATAVGAFTWQDLVMLAWEVPVQWHSGAVYLMNQRTLAQVLTMSDAMSRPILSPMPQGVPGFTMAGFPIIIASQMPDIAPGSTPVLFGNLKEAYTLVTRRALTLQPDPYTAAWCMLFRFDARIGGAPLCANACRLLRIR